MHNGEFTGAGADSDDEIKCLAWDGSIESDARKYLDSIQRQ